MGKNRGLEIRNTTFIPPPVGIWKIAKLTKNATEPIPTRTCVVNTKFIHSQLFIQAKWHIDESTEEPLTNLNPQNQ